MNLMLINVSTRRFGRAVRLPEGDVPSGSGSGVSKSAASRRFVALSSEKLAAFMTADLSKLDLLVVQIDGLHVSDDLVLVAAIGIEGDGDKHPLAVVEGATENTATVQALLDNLIERGLDPGDIRQQRRDPEMPDPQGPQHHRPAAEGASCSDAAGAAPGLGTR